MRTLGQAMNEAPGREHWEGAHRLLVCNTNSDRISQGEFVDCLLSILQPVSDEQFERTLADAQKLSDGDDRSRSHRGGDGGGIKDRPSRLRRSTIFQPATSEQGRAWGLQQDESCENSINP